MFRIQNAAMALMAQAQTQTQLGPQQCVGFTCGHTIWCGWYIHSYPTEVLALQYPAGTLPQVACQAASVPIPIGNPGDPVEQLQALRRQLEIALAGVQAQERVAIQQRDEAQAPPQPAEKK
jgi:hypothetical protein